MGASIVKGLTREIGFIFIEASTLLLATSITCVWGRDVGVPMLFYSMLLSGIELIMASRDRMNAVLTSGYHPSNFLGGGDAIDLPLC